MKQKSGPGKAPAEQVLKDIRRQTRRQYSAEEKIRIVLEGVARFPLGAGHATGSRANGRRRGSALKGACAKLDQGASRKMHTSVSRRLHRAT